MQRLKKFFAKLGPGFVTGAADDDPSGIATYAQTGAIFGYQQLWTALFSFPFMTAVQEMCGRIGLVTGKGIAGVIRAHYSKKLLVFVVTLLLIANTINIGTDLGAMAASARLVLPIPYPVLLISITALTLLLEIFITYRTYAKYLKYLSFTLLAYVAVTFIVKQDWGLILHSTIVPTITFSKTYLLNIVAILGTTISPYLFFWQANEEVEEEIATHKLQQMGKGIPRVQKEDIAHMRIDTAIGMFFSNSIMFFIIATMASTLHTGGRFPIQDAAEAAQALQPLAGDFASLLFALGIIGAGLLAVPILAASASYALAEALGWKTGLYRKFNKAHGFYGIITIATLIGLLINFTRIPPFSLLYYTAVLNGIIAPPLLFIVMRITNNKQVMGNYTNTRTSNIFGWGITIIMFIAAGALLAMH